MSDRILVTPRSLSAGEHPALQPLKEAGFALVRPTPGAMPSEAQLIAAVPGCVGWLAGIEPVSAAVIDAAHELRVIARNGTGIDNFPLAAMEARGISLRRAMGENARGVAELALALTLAALRDLVPTHLAIRDGQWLRRIGTEIHGTEVSVVGLGAVGSLFVEFCLGLGAHVRGYDPLLPPDAITHPNFRRGAFDAVLDGARVLSLHAPMPASGRPLVGAGEIARLAKGAFVVNTARAGLVDADAMLAALESGQVATYATDVFECEPPSPSPLLAHPQVIMTSHIGGFTTASVERAAARAVSNLLEVLVVDAHPA
jgi:D-3-phosphoglycerate dehydrogenase / 2-oxoglutarate reductase